MEITPRAILTLGSLASGQDQDISLLEVWFSALLLLPELLCYMVASGRSVMRRPKESGMRSSD